MGRVWTQTRLELLLMFRYRFAPLALGLGLMAGLLVRAFFSPEQRALALPLGLVTGIGGTGLFLSATLLWLERREGAWGLLKASPLKTKEYLAGKFFSAALVFIGFGLASGIGALGVQALFHLPGLILLGFAQTGWGLYFALKRPAMGDFIFPALGLVFLYQLPGMGLLAGWPIWFLRLLPGYGPLSLMLWPDRTEGWLLSFGWAFFAYWMAAQALRSDGRA